MIRNFLFLVLASVLCITTLGSEDEVPMPHVKMLDADNFDSHVSSGLSGMTKGTLVAFVASWCGHCKRLKPTYEKLAEAFDGEMFVDIAMIDADKHRKIGEKYNVAGFPTIK